ncbi:MAG TPA: hypothetical protein VL327_03845 [Pyrinomonadaceae bacterium]|nr:hypothetical protein [Pyrinomonadaceae bacterium]
MKLTRGLVGLILSFSLAFISFLTLPQRPVTAQEQNAALQRGYRTGYSDGYMSGYRDVLDNVAKDFASHSEYTEASRAYSKDYGSIEDYRDGYQQGFESGYGTGYDKKTFDAAVPSQLARRATTAPAAQNGSESNAASPLPPAQESISQPADTAQASDSTTQPVSYRSTDAMIIIPADTELIVELQDDIGTERSKEGDKFTAKIVSPVEIAGATIEGRVAKIQKPGRIKKRSELSFSFDRIVLNQNRWSNFNAVLTEVLPVKGDNVRRVDDEGTAVGKSTVKGDTITIGGATGTGLVVGAIAGGPVGAAVGAGVGAAFGVGAVVIDRGKHINLAKNQQLRIKTSYETKIR